jgi:hypothetical protein
VLPDGFCLAMRQSHQQQHAPVPITVIVALAHILSPSARASSLPLPPPACASVCVCLCLPGGTGFVVVCKRDSYFPQIYGSIHQVLTDNGRTDSSGPFPRTTEVSCDCRSSVFRGKRMREEDTMERLERQYLLFTQPFVCYLTSTLFPRI